MRFQLRPDVKALMVNEIARPVFGIQLGVMASCPFADLTVERIISDQLDSVLIPPGRIVRGIVSGRIEVRSAHLFGAEQTHIISARRTQPAVGAVEIIVSCLAVIRDIRSLSGLVVPSDQVDAKVSVRKVSGAFVDRIRSGVNGFSGCGIKFQEEHSAGPGAV